MEIFSQKGTDTVFWNDFNLKSNNPIISRVLSAPDTFQLQILFTEIVRKKELIFKKGEKFKDKKIKNLTTNFIHHPFNVNDTQYFYPASTVKLPLLLTSLEKINKLNFQNNQINEFTTLSISANGKCQVPQFVDETNLNGKKINIAHFIKRILLVSDNSAYNRLYEFCGQDFLNFRLHEKGFSKTNIIQRFWPGCDSCANACTNEFKFLDPKNQLIYKQSNICAKEIWQNPFKNPFIGNSFKYGNQITGPLNCKNSNSISVEELHSIMMRLVFPDKYNENQKFDITDSQRNFVLKYASMHALDSKNPLYNSQNGYFQAYKKYLIYGRDEKAEMDSNIRIYNIVGWSYGYLIDCAYILDLQSGTDFFLTSVIYCNKDGILNDDVYNYTDIGFPFLKILGKNLIDHYRDSLHLSSNKLEQKQLLRNFVKSIEID